MKLLDLILILTVVILIHSVYNWKLIKAQISGDDIDEIPGPASSDVIQPTGGKVPTGWTGQVDPYASPIVKPQCQNGFYAALLRNGEYQCIPDGMVI